MHCLSREISCQRYIFKGFYCYAVIILYLHTVGIAYCYPRLHNRSPVYTSILQRCITVLFFSSVIFLWGHHCMFGLSTKTSLWNPWLYNIQLIIQKIYANLWLLRFPQSLKCPNHHPSNLKIDSPLCCMMFIHWTTIIDITFSQLNFPWSTAFQKEV